ncbi:Putative type II secretion system protein E [Anatilimnocola aggregata]|uniref:Type II secretion system protein E n=1 Tax=Anatilimnocola aggregata TaxID=2528021 RepID=A0A517YHJ6_9BACT|nr:ATPase, T2SS/T4P/T4SS family [Anatilimnocola aggregata]QDU29693.1 Putative type II secretion system protein E [Anatilimnocola aggregata]
MSRIVTSCIGAALIVLIGAGVAQAQFIEYISGLEDPHAMIRGRGFYLAIWKIVLLLLVFWMWVKTTDWINRDSGEIGNSIGLPPDLWNPIVVFSFLLTFVIAMLIPIYLAGFFLILIAYIAPLATYIALRNGRVTNERKVLTPDHFKRVIANIGRGKKGPVEEKQPWELGPAVDMQATGPIATVNQANMIEARQSPAYVPVKKMIADALENRAEKVMLDFTADAVALRYYVDGVWHAGNPKIHEKEQLNRQWGDQMLFVLKKLAALNPADRRSKQEGKLKIEYAGNKYDTILMSQGTQTGERAVITLLLVTKHIRSLEELGMREKQRDQLKEILGMGNTGVVAFCAMPGDGLTATWVAALRATDRLLRDFISIEDAGQKEPEIENVNAQRVNSAAGETIESVLPKVLLKMPEVLCVPNITSGAVLGVLTQKAEDDAKLGIVSLRAKEAADALLRLLALKPPMPQFAQQMRAVINQRLIRKLCDSCKQAIPLTPELSQRLGIPPGRVDHIYREYQPPTPEQLATMKKHEIPPTCPKCRGLGYFGRTAIYEFLVLDERVKQALIQQPKLEVIKQVARQAGNRSLQEEGIVLIALGVTSLPELQRVLKQ